MSFIGLLCLIPTQNALTPHDLIAILNIAVTVCYAAEQTIVAILDASLLIRSSDGVTDLSLQLRKHQSNEKKKTLGLSKLYKNNKTKGTIAV